MQYRNHSDYDDFYIASRDITAEQVANAKVFINEIEVYIKNYIINI